MPHTEWVALDATTDPRSRAAELAQIHHQALSGGSVRGRLREVVARSWARSSGAGVDPEHSLAPLVIDEDEVSQRWADHPLSVGHSMMLQLLEQPPSHAPQVALVCAADGTLLWLDGEPHARDGGRRGQPRARRPVERGAGGHERDGHGAGRSTTRCRSSPPSTSHCSVHGWTCTAAPVHDPETDELLGVLDLSGPLGTAHPHSLPLVAAAARLLETVLALRADDRNALLPSGCAARVGTRRGQADALASAAGPGARRPRGVARASQASPIPPGGGEVTLHRRRHRVGRAGRRNATATCSSARRARRPAREPGRRDSPGSAATVWCSRSAASPAPSAARHSEILVLLATRPRGLTAEQLARRAVRRLRQAGDHPRRDVAPAHAARAAACSPRRIGSPSPRTRTSCSSPSGSASRRWPTCVADYIGPLLPRSEVPGVVEIREWLDERVRGAVLASGDSAALVAWLHSEPGADDLVACRAPRGPARPRAPRPRVRAQSPAPAERLGALRARRRAPRGAADRGQADSVRCDDDERRTRADPPAPRGDTRPAQAARGLSLTQLR